MKYKFTRMETVIYYFEVESENQAKATEKFGDMDNDEAVGKKLIDSTSDFAGEEPIEDNDDES